MAFAKDDPAIIWLLFEYQYLSTSQLSRILKRSRQVVLRRLRELRKLGFVKAMDTEIMSDNCYCLAQKGCELIAGEMNTTVSKLPFSKGAVKAQATFWKHTLLTNSIRIALTESASQHDELLIHRHIPEWEQVERPRRRSKNNKHDNYLLWERLEDEKKRKFYDHRPDGLILVGRKSDPPDTYAGLFIEADRGTEDIARKIKNKFNSYRLFYDQKLYYKNFGASVMRVLFVLSDITTDRRIHNMQNLLQKLAYQLKDKNPEPHGSPASFVHCFRFLRFDHLSDQTAWSDKLWQDWQGGKHSLFNAPDKVQNNIDTSNYQETQGA